ncbi:MAG TPA: hypothetical protein VLB74_01365 [Flavobacterium sp.]|uniref:hypothetical protein n=1 Tax=Flavobacterium sp. TaxID=239 RepID=UPI002BBBCC1A|nr:hypothetical protein [Flavobacterium sp.]HSD13275.1 hypothetical protein [Flavobacterium sp.]
MKSIDKYLFQALDNYPYSLEETVESLDYALSYDDKNTIALCLYGRLYSEQLHRYEVAKEYFQQAIGIDIHALEVYVHYIQALILNEDFAEAEKLIDFALTVKGINKAEILLKRVLLLESQRKFEDALEAISEVKVTTFSNDTSYETENAEKRLKEKIDLLKDKKKGKDKKEKSKKSEKEKKKKQ